MHEWLTKRKYAHAEARKGMWARSMLQARVMKREYTQAERQKLTSVLEAGVTELDMDEVSVASQAHEMEVHTL